MSTILKADSSSAVTLPAELCRAAGVEPDADLVARGQAGRIVLQGAPLLLAERWIVDGHRLLSAETHGESIRPAICILAFGNANSYNDRPYGRKDRSFQVG